MCNHTLTLHTQSQTLSIHFAGQPLLMEVLQAQGVAFAHPCSGRGTCGKCAVEQVRGAVSPANEAEERAGVRLSCQMHLLGDCEVSLREMTGFAGQTIQNEKFPSRLGLAVDIGSTTLDIRLLDLDTGAGVAEVSALNPQASFAADVIGRITAAMEGKGGAMKAALFHRLEAMTEAFPPVERAVMTGNTVMLYLLTGRDPGELARAPFAVSCRFGHTETILQTQTYLPRCIGAFTGADLTCALLASGLTGQTENALLCDIGTNGEIALWHAGRLYVTSTAVGPAFEGAGISCGMGGTAGAIDKVWAAPNALGVHVIGGGAPRGICGSGLIDAVAALLRLDWIDSTGAMETDTLPIAGDVALTRQDIRQVQLAKAAVAAGIEILLDTAGLDAKEIQTLYIAGGFGSHLDPRSAAAIGLFPPVLTARVRVLGNAALQGAALLLMEDGQRKKADQLADTAEIVPLSGNPLFAEKFIAHMNF